MIWGREMLQIEFVPDLDHCIETLARKEYSEIVSQLLASVKGDGKLSEKVELMRNFLETADFKRLRAEYERYLVEGKDVKFIIYAEGGASKYKIKISPEP
jgi:hypothetical protein